MRLIWSTDGPLCLRSATTSIWHNRCRRGPSTPTHRRFLHRDIQTHELCHRQRSFSCGAGLMGPAPAIVREGTATSVNREAQSPRYTILPRRAPSAVLALAGGVVDSLDLAGELRRRLEIAALLARV